jgi:hypothetical protein
VTTKKLKAARTTLGLTQAEFAYFQVSPRAVGGWKQGARNGFRHTNPVPGERQDAADIDHRHRIGVFVERGLADTGGAVCQRRQAKAGFQLVAIIWQV